MVNRQIKFHYEDPVDLIWIRAADELGLKIDRSTEVFAAYDGNGTLTISDSSDFDADDCLAQMIFHEICHWLVAGRRGYLLEDWGLSNIDDQDVVYEYAAIRLQASLARPYGLGDFFAVTTDWRPYWDSLPKDTLADGDDPAIDLARDAAHLARLEPFASVLKRALSATAAIADVVRDVSDPGCLWSQTRERHRLGSLLSTEESKHCGECAWSFFDHDVLRCRQHDATEGHFPEVEESETACERWEPKLTGDDCQSCGACCREGFHVLTVNENETFRVRYPQLVQLCGEKEYHVPRPNGVCVALDGDGSQTKPFRCRHYEDRPANCADFEVGGDACLVARRRVGLSQ